VGVRSQLKNFHTIVYVIPISWYDIYINKRTNEGRNTVTTKEELGRAFEDLRAAQNFRPTLEPSVNKIQLIQVVIFAITVILIISLV
jgi:hypothetical protein